MRVYREIIREAQRLAMANGRDFQLFSPGHSPREGKKVAEWYMDSRCLVAVPREGTEHARWCWGELGKEINRQYEILSRYIAVVMVTEDAYTNTDQMFADIDDGRLQVTRTEVHGSHPLWSNEQNDRFRAVHDTFGHYVHGVSFSRAGEDAAYRGHMMTMPHNGAAAALFTETQGQNMALHYAKPYHVFKEQKIIVPPPSWLS